jgi:hypothetical protein
MLTPPERFSANSPAPFYGVNAIREDWIEPLTVRDFMVPGR